ncbi:MAG: hypothetical protein PUG18_06560 [Lachnospiraceae bacterium]|nr:hypothetical protein [Lachnospiraceae bacterium]
MRKKTDRQPELWNALPWLSVMALVILMMAAAELLHEKEIIFPEITALAVGYILAKKRAWIVDSKRILILITGCAVLGLLIVLYIPLSLRGQICLAFAVSQLIFLYSGTTLAPFVSAIVLPVILQTKSWIYPVSAFLLTLVVIALHGLFIRLGIREDEPYVPTAIPTRQEWFDAVLRTVVVSAAACFALKYNVRFVIAPPLLVAFTEFSRPLNPARKRPVKVILLLTACAAAGTLCRLVLTNAAGLPLSVSAGAATLIMMLLVRKTGMYMPPAGAVTILTFLVPDEALVFFPLQVLAGISLLMGITLLMFEPLQKGRA